MGVVIEVNQRARIDVTLKVGEVKQSVQVSADVTSVDTYTASVNETVDSRRMVDLPLNGRQALQLQTLLPGVVPAAQGQAASFIARQSSEEVRETRSGKSAANCELPSSTTIACRP